MARYAIFVYDDVEPIDLGATFGVLSMAKRIAANIEAFSVAKSGGQVRCANGLTILVDHDIVTCPRFDALIVTGGPGWQQAASDAETLAFIRTAAAFATTASICTGAMLLAAAGVLDGKVATTKVQVTGDEIPPIERLAKTFTNVEVAQATAVMLGGILTSGGVSLGIDGVLYLIGELEGPAVMAETARILEYGRALKANAAALPPIGLPSVAR